MHPNVRKINVPRSCTVLVPYVCHVGTRDPSGFMETIGGSVYYISALSFSKRTTNRILLCIDRPTPRTEIRNTKHIGDSVQKDRELIVDRCQREVQYKI